ncbi:hypothetical protein SCUCBS95973_009865 [Sporothrix curviconia]|uniref:Uncharacterized protein n=1 Tax=Sporothrix curviconia TaxID=1260050 RepID=A0ABP0D0Z4_9PEZI
MIFTANRRWQFGALALLVFIWTVSLFHRQIVPAGMRPWHHSSHSTEGHKEGHGEGQTSDSSPPLSPSPPKQHGNVHVTPTNGGFDYTVKTIAYVFPQFHPIPENDKNWGVNFTDWDNVKKVTHNSYGLETLRPTEEIGYYNLLDYGTRARYGQLIRDMGFYGIAYHHYWFHHPVMEKVPAAILQDGQPDVPFLLSWANEPWTATWDGMPQSKVLQEQDYGDMEHWRVHFDWLLQFFEHPLYINVQGRPQFMIYNPGGLGELGIHMFAAFRRWAIEAGFPGMDIIETRVQPEEANNRGLSDAMSEFLFRSGSGLDATEWPSTKRVSKVYHRGASVTWDNTPRYRARGTANIFAHPTLWTIQVLEIMRRMKLEPNPVGEENFLFVNALNEWGEGNVLEPSVQWGDGFARSARAAIDKEKTLLPWRDQKIDAGLKMVASMARSSEAGMPIDVCVLVPMRTCVARFTEPDTASELLDSLIAQANPNWRAFAYRASSRAAESKFCEKHVWDTFDPRITYADDAVPSEVLDQDAYGASTLFSTQHVLAHLEELSPVCAGARYLLVAREDSAYDAAAFDLVQTGGSPDIVGLRYMTANTLATALNKPGGPEAWDRYCKRLDDSSEDICAAAQPDTPAADLALGATLLSLAKIKQLAITDNLFATANTSATPDQAILQKLHSEAGWSWVASTHAKGSCDLVGGHTYKSCGRTGRIWLDVPSTQSTYTSQCMSLHSIANAHGWLVDQWDMVTWRENPFCLRVSQEKYGELFAAGA